MRRLQYPFVLAALALITTSSCKKSVINTQAAPTRRIKYRLYTTLDFSGDTKTIRFSLLMKNKSRILFDSALAPMKINEIPRADHPIVIERDVPDNDKSDLSVGFLYAIDGVGSSWHLDTCLAGNVFKEIEFAFR